MKLATGEQMGRIDRRAIEGGIPSLTLMECAATALANQVVKLLNCGGTRPYRVAVFCGTGNNGGDGIACARLLLEQGVAVRTFLVGNREKMTTDARAMVVQLEEVGGVLEDFDPSDPWYKNAQVFVDALYGTGLNSPLRGDGLTAVMLMNDSPAPVVSADIPSGVLSHSGQVLNHAVKAAVTVTFSMAKVGHFVGKGSLHTGKLVVAPIGIPEVCLAEEKFYAHTVDKLVLPQRAPDGHKGHFGRVFILAGSVGYTGAPILAAQGALRSGAGLITLGVPAEIYPIIAVKCNEVMPRPVGLCLDDILELTERCHCVLLGPGLGRSEEVSQLVCHLLERLPCPVVLDADGINAVAAHIDVLDGRARAGRTTVLTPHDGEFTRLGGDLSVDDRIGQAQKFAVDHGCITVLKGHRTITAYPNGHCAVNTTGNVGMAKGGSGDVLAGIITSLMGQGVPNAVEQAVWLHGRAGDLCRERLGVYAMTPTDLAETLAQVTKKF